MKILILGFMLLFSINIFAQNRVCYTYDVAGNRISSTHCFKSAPAEQDSTKIKNTITESMGGMRITCYPNPTKGELSVELLNLPSDIQSQITLHDLSGKCLLWKTALKETTLLDLSFYPIGTYVLRLEVSDTVCEWKVIKN